VRLYPTGAVGWRWVDIEWHLRICAVVERGRFPSARAHTVVRAGYGMCAVDLCQLVHQCRHRHRHRLWRVAQQQQCVRMCVLWCMRSRLARAGVGGIILRSQV
jgi:hypothetical protein